MIMLIIKVKVGNKHQVVSIPHWPLILHF